MKNNDIDFLRIDITEKEEVKIIAQDGFIKMSKEDRVKYLDIAKELFIRLWLKAENELEEKKENGSKGY